MTTKHNGNIELELDWYALAGWQCPFCGGEIDHVEDEDFDGYTENSYACETKGGTLCDHAFMVRRLSAVDEDDDSEADVLKYWVLLTIPAKYMNEAETGSDILTTESDG